MKKIEKYLILIFLATIPGACRSQSFSVKPYFGYAQVQMSEVNSDSRARVDNLILNAEQNLPYPDPFEGNYAWGIQIGYHLEDNYFLTVGTYYFKEPNNLNYQDISAGYPVQFTNERMIEYFEINFGMKYLFNYSSWKRFHFYLAGSGGFALGWSESVFKYSDDINTVDNKGDFSSNALIGLFSVGISLRLSSIISIEPEIGYRVANLSQMEGTLKVSQNFPNIPDGQIEGTDNNYRTESNYNYSGYFANIGINFLIDFPN
jgi:hypothetical protein